MSTSASTSVPPGRPATTIRQIQAMYARGEKIAMLTCYDASFSSLMGQCGVDTILVGDSLGNVVQGQSTTLPVTIDDIAYHTACVARGNRGCFLIADMLFGSYGTPESAFDNAVKLMRAGAQMVKIEGGAWVAPTIRFLVERSVPVCAHVGLTPQSVHALGGFRVQAKKPEEAQRLIADAQAVQDAGAQMIVIEAIASALGEEVTKALHIPTIGIGAGAGCSDQVLVMHDMLGVFPGHTAKFVKNFMQGKDSVQAAVSGYVAEVKAGTFPAAEHGFS
ncbi:MAG: 3-methyl-2-oxobutanoate hydroxymethyltransferase [Candidatus Protistobacter heckmanni]|nr:3-methyl-2-oxobutanoate hydroxymethyltransferase [Candidatus Protistobacter heckmanni]